MFSIATAAERENVIEPAADAEHAQAPHAVQENKVPEIAPSHVQESPTVSCTKHAPSSNYAGESAARLEHGLGLGSRSETLETCVSK
jgi:hypothetical protein